MILVKDAKSSNSSFIEVIEEPPIEVIKPGDTKESDEKIKTSKRERSGIQEPVKKSKLDTKGKTKETEKGWEWVKIEDKKKQQNVVIKEITVEDSPVKLPEKAKDLKLKASQSKPVECSEYRTADRSSTKPKKIVEAAKVKEATSNENNNNGSKKLSNSMKDAVRTECKICRLGLINFNIRFSSDFIFQAIIPSHFFEIPHQVSP